MSQFSRFPFNPDEAGWALAGEMMRAGSIPYRDIAEMRTPGTLGLYYVGQSITPWSFSGIRAITTLFNGLTVLLVFFICRQIGGKNCGAIAAVLLTLSVLNPNLPHDYLAAESEQFMILFTVLGFWALLRSLDAPSPWWPMLWGTCGFWALMMKQSGGADFFGMTVGLLVLSALHRLPWMQTFRLMAIGIGTGVLWLVLLGMLFASLGALSDMIYCTITFGFTVYAEDRAKGAEYALLFLDLATPQLLRMGLIAWPYLLFSGFQAKTERELKWRDATLLLLAWFLGSVLGSLLGARTYNHYLIQLFPALAIACDLCLIRLLSSAPMAAEDADATPAATAIEQDIPASKLIALTLLVAMVNASATILWISGFISTPSPTSSEALAKIVVQNSQPKDRILLWGYDPATYFLSRRLASCSDFNSAFVSGWVPDAPLATSGRRVVQKIRTKYLAELEQHPPQLIIDCSQAGFVPIETFPEFQALVNKEYRLLAEGPARLFCGTGTIRVLERIPAEESAQDADGGPSP